MTRIAITALLIVGAFTALMIVPVFTGTFVGDIELHAALLFEVFPPLIIVLFIGSIADELTR